MIRDVTDLEVYNESLRLLKVLYEFLKRIPKAEYDSVLQLKRAAKSVPANIAEGFAKRSSEKEFKRFLKIALGSNDEVTTHLRTLKITVEHLAISVENLIEQYTILSKRINKLLTIWRSGFF
ncbi:MAG TPA: four helix bundle protein [Candidatus Eisenbacteria bacterium]|nr:four helix bundle protein [Candidatus Eisenbacteria bacterium]